MEQNKNKKIWWYTRGLFRDESISPRDNGPKVSLPS